jgi:hypothetical protein
VFCARALCCVGNLSLLYGTSDFENIFQWLILVTWGGKRHWSLNLPREQTWLVPPVSVILILLHIQELYNSYSVNIVNVTKEIRMR